MPTDGLTSPCWAGVRRRAPRSWWCSRRSLATASCGPCPGGPARRSMSTVAAAWAGDVSGDGRADLILRQHPAEGGVADQDGPHGQPAALRPRAHGEYAHRLRDRAGPEQGEGRPRGRRSRRPGGRAAAQRRSSGRASVLRLQGQALGAFKRVPMWTAPRSDRVAVEKTRLGAADVDNDGMTDLVLFSRDPSGTRIRVLLAALRQRCDLVSTSWKASTG